MKRARISVMLKAMIACLLFAMFNSLPARGEEGSELSGKAPDADAQEIKAKPVIHERGLVKGFELKGDLDGDGELEIVLALWEKGSAEALFTYLVILDLRQGQVISRSVFVGDRVQLLGGEIDGGTISVDVILQAQDDGVCCSSQKVTYSWAWQKNGSFKVLPMTIKGGITVEDMGGTVWILSRMADKDLPSEPQITLEYEDGRITGSGGCNRYFADMKDQESLAGNIKTGPVGSTRKACAADVMEREAQYLKRLGQVNRFHFSQGQLVFSWGDAERSGELTFVPGRKVE